MPKLPPMDNNVNHAPHVVLLGAGASIAAYLDWGKKGARLPSMQDLLDVLSLRVVIKDAGYSTTNLNFEAFYDELCSSGANESLKAIIESRVYEFFGSLALPNEPTIYDHLILSLRKKDIIATFNWDPFLVEAYMRNEVVTEKHRPRIAFLHGNVKIGTCYSCNVAGVNGRRCPRCKEVLAPSKLLYPVKHKNYNSDPYIMGEWDTLRRYLNHAYFLTIFGYSAPVTDVEARSLMLGDWSTNPALELAEVEIIDIRSRNDLENTWQDFFIRQHYMISENIYQSYLFTHPRRSCDAFAAATLMCAPWGDNPFPKFKTLRELQEWVAPLIAEEEQYDTKRVAFSGDPIAPNEKIEL